MLENTNKFNEYTKSKSPNFAYYVPEDIVLYYAICMCCVTTPANSFT